MAQVLETPEASSIADGVTASFPIPFTFAARAEVEVTVETAAGVRTLQVLNTDYTIPDGDWLETGGNVVFISGHLPADDSYVERRRVTPAEQPVSFGDQAAFRPTANETAFDKATRQAAEAKAALDRSSMTPVGEPGLQWPRAALRRGKVLGFEDNANAQPIMVPNEAVAVAEDVAASAASAATATTQAGIATTQAGIATTQAGIANTKAGQAETARSGAVAAQTQAEIALAAFNASGIFYASETAGRAAVADGAVFYVIAVPGDVLNIYRRVNAGTVSTLLMAVPASRPQPVVDCTVAGTNSIVMTPKTGYVASGSGQRFKGKAAATNTGAVNADVPPVTGGEARQVRLRDGGQVPAGLIREGQVVEIEFVADEQSPIYGLWELIVPTGSAVPQPVVDCTVAGTNSIVMTPKSGYVVSGNGQRFKGKAAATNTGAVNADVPGATNGDVRQVRLPDGSQVPAGLIREGQALEIEFVEDEQSPLWGLWELIEPKAEATSADTTTAATSFYAAANSRIYAQRAFGK